MVNFVRALLYTLALTTTVLSLPFPYKPAVGEVVDIAGGVEYRPHVTIGHTPEGNAILSPVVHEHEVGDRPSISGKGMGLPHGSRILLQPIIAHPSMIDSAPRTKQDKIKGKRKTVGAKDLARIQKHVAHHLSKAHGQKR
ncbi:hypothetical protein CVT26_012481 [Gymnopilus dilepis]|uniref:Uncharacterized protein n=1 Tax=Gymnopilus dilepis TaxID=231916 RepID=A0A409YCW1_9AGAR|nr:hypothetical protein CVT26_012481 [Gymnopilus dilepis]